MVRMIIRYIVIVCFIQGTPILAQDNLKSTKLSTGNNLYFIFFDDGSLGLINYDKLFVITSSIILSGGLEMVDNRIIPFCPCGGFYPKPDTYLTIPHNFIYNFCRKMDYYKLGSGRNTVFDNNLIHSNQKLYFFPVIEYSLEPIRHKKLVFLTEEIIL